MAASLPVRPDRPALVIGGTAASGPALGSPLRPPDPA